MKILHIITNLQTGGAEKLMVDLLPRVKDMEYEVDLLLFDGTHSPFYEMLKENGVSIHVLGHIHNVYHPLYLFRLTRFLCRHQYDIVHTHNTAPQLFAAICSIFCSVVLVTTEHSTSNRRRNWTWYRPIDCWMYQRYARIICISDAAEKNLREYLGVNYGAKICTIYNGVDVQRFASAKPAADLIASKNKKAIVMVARFTYQKDQDTLIRAMAFLSKDEWEVWLVGEGERKEALKQLAVMEGVANNVRFLGVRMDIPSVLKAADVIVMSSHFEGLSLSNIEGMSAGKPFLASDVDGLREVTTGAGILFPHEDAKALANHIQHLGNSPTLSIEVAAKCKERALQYDIRTMAQNYCEVYKALMVRTGLR